MNNLLKRNVLELAAKRGITVNKLEQEVEGLKPGNVKHWDKSAPSIDRVAAVADYFGVSVDYLLGRASETIVYMPEEFQKLDAENRKKVMEYIDLLLMKQAERKNVKIGG